MASPIGDGLSGKTNARPDSASGNDGLRLRDLRQWYARSSRTVKTDFLRKTLDACDEDASFSYVARKTFGRVCSGSVGARDVAVGGGRNNDFPPDALPADDDGRRSLRRGHDEKTKNEYIDWFYGLSRVDRAAVFIRLVLFGGIDAIVAVCEHVRNRLVLSDDGDTPGLLELFSNETPGSMHNPEVTLSRARYNDDDGLPLTSGPLLESGKLLSKSALSNNEAKITDFVYEDYSERTNEWENKLNSFDQKYCANHTNGTAEADSGLVQTLPVHSDVPFREKSLNDVDGENNDSSSSKKG